LFDTIADFAGYFPIFRNRIRVFEPRFAVVGELELRGFRRFGSGVSAPGDARGEFLLQAPDRRMIAGKLHKRETIKNPTLGKQRIHLKSFNFP
jgi:hypothetical protein